MTTLVGRPRLVALAEDRELVRARVAGTTGSGEAVAAWQALHAGIVASCDGGAAVPTADPLDPGATWSAAAVARNCAFLAWLDEDPARAASAAGLLATLPTDAHALSDPADDVHLATAIGLAAQAWDLLVAVDPAADGSAPLALTRSTWDRYVVTEPLWLAAWRNNHNVKLAAAFGMAALAWSEEPEASTWAAYSQTELSFLVDELSAGDGGWGEGPYYQMYGAMQLLPYLRAWHRLLGDTGESFAVSCANHLGDCDPAPIPVGDLWVDPRWTRAFAWNRDVRRPDGLRPAVDDGLPVGFPSGLLTELDPRFGRDWLDQQLATWAGDARAELLAGFDGAEAPITPSCVVRPESGFTTLDAGDAWALLLGEPDGVMAEGGHEHADAGTITVYLAGREVALDPAYAGWTQRAATSAYEEHSGLLVDGEGPTAATLAWAQGADCAATLTVSWGEVAWGREVRVTAGAVAVIDRVAGGTSRELRFQLRSGEGTGTAEPQPWGAVLRYPDAAVVVVTTDPTSWGTGTWAPEYGVTEPHDRLSVSSDGDTLTVLVAGPVDWAPVVSVGERTVTIDGRSWSAG